MFLVVFILAEGGDWAHVVAKRCNFAWDSDVINIKLWWASDDIRNGALAVKESVLPVVRGEEALALLELALKSFVFIIRDKFVLMSELSVLRVLDLRVNPSIADGDTLEVAFNV